MKTITSIEIIPVLTRAAMRILIKEKRELGLEVNPLDRGSKFSGVKRWGVEVVTYKNVPDTLSINRKPTHTPMKGLVHVTAHKAKNYLHSNNVDQEVNVYYKQSRI